MMLSSVLHTAIAMSSEGACSALESVEKSDLALRRSCFTIAATSA